MFWKRTALLAIFLVTMGLSACHVVDESQSQVSIAKPAQEFVARVEGKVEEISPSIPLPKLMPSKPLATGPKYILQPNNPAYAVNFAHPETKCSWIGIAGQVFDLNQNPVPNIVVELKGTMNGTPISELGMTGTATIYGPAGYELLLGGQPFDSQNSLTVQLLDAKGKPISQLVQVNTYKDCQKNLILINFSEEKSNYHYNFPVIVQSKPGV